MTTKTRTTKTIDAALAEYAGREILSFAEFADVLLDIRNASILDNQELQDVVACPA